MAKIDCPNCKRQMDTNQGVCMSCFTRVLPSGKIDDNQKKNSYVPNSVNKNTEASNSSQIVAALIMVSVIVGGYLLLADSPEEKRLAAEAEAREQAENRRKGFHCLSSFDGSHRQFKAEIKQMLHNPDSFDHVETRVTPADALGNHTLVMTYRATNGFGAIVTQQAMATMKQFNCEATLVSTNL